MSIFILVQHKTPSLHITSLLKNLNSIFIFSRLNYKPFGMKHRAIYTPDQACPFALYPLHVSISKYTKLLEVFSNNVLLCFCIYCLECVHSCLFTLWKQSQYSTQKIISYLSSEENLSLSLNNFLAIRLIFMYYYLVILKNIGTKSSSK